MSEFGGRLSAGMLRTSALALAFLFLACTDSTAPVPVFWGYNLLTVNGSPPISATSQIATATEKIASGGLDLKADGTWSTEFDIYLIPPTPTQSNRILLSHGTWTRAKETFTLLDSSNRSIMTATHTESFLSVVSGSDTLVFEIACWPKCYDIGF